MKKLRVMNIRRLTGIICFIVVLIGSGRLAGQPPSGERCVDEELPTKIGITKSRFFGILTVANITPKLFDEGVNASSVKNMIVISDRNTIRQYMSLINGLSGEPKYKNLDTRARLLLFYQNGRTDTLYMDSGAILKDGRYYLNDSNLVKLVAVGDTTVSMEDLIMGLEYKLQQQK